MFSLAVVVAVRLWILPPPVENGESRIDARSLYPEVSRLISEHYVDPVKPGDAWPAAYSALLKRLDPFSAYVPPRLIPASRGWREGRGYWAGIWIRHTPRGYKVSRILPAQSAVARDFRVGDVLESIDGIGLTGETWGTARLLLYSPVKREFKLGVHREGLAESTHMALPALPLPGDLEIRRLSPDTRVMHIYRITPAAVKAVDAGLKAHPRHKWIIDLRNYMYGDLAACLSLADLLLPPLSRLELRSRNATQRIRAGNPKESPPRMAVLTGASTIMYAEILARLAQAAGYPLMGERTGGFTAHLFRSPLPDGGELVIPDGYFFWDGKDIRHASLTPRANPDGDESLLGLARTVLEEY